MRYCFALLLLVFSVTAFGQQKTDKDKLIQFSGIITDIDSGNVIPYVTITNLSAKSKRVGADYRGYFTFIVILAIRFCLLQLVTKSFLQLSH